MKQMQITDWGKRVNEVNKMADSQLKGIYFQYFGERPWAEKLIRRGGRIAFLKFHRKNTINAILRFEDRKLFDGEGNLR